MCRYIALTLLFMGENIHEFVKIQFPQLQCLVETPRSNLVNFVEIKIENFCHTADS